MIGAEDPPRARLVRDVFAVFLIVAGAVGLLWAAVATDWRVAFAVLSGYAVIGGVALGRGE